MKQRDLSEKHYTEEEGLGLARAWICVTQRSISTEDKIWRQAQRICKERYGMEGIADYLRIKWTRFQRKCVI